MKALNAYLIFNGNCREAMQFYAKGLGGDLTMMTYAEAPMPAPKDTKDWIIHARLSKGAAVLMASDTHPGMPVQQGNNYHVAVQCESAQEVDRLFAALGGDGKAAMPPQETFWAPRFAMFTDRFGIHWMLNFEKAK